MPASSAPAHPGKPISKACSIFLSFLLGLFTSGKLRLGLACQPLPSKDLFLHIPQGLLGFSFLGSLIQSAPSISLQNFMLQHLASWTSLFTSGLFLPPVSIPLPAYPNSCSVPGSPCKAPLSHRTVMATVLLMPPCAFRLQSSLGSQWPPGIPSPVQHLSSPF